MKSKAIKHFLLSLLISLLIGLFFILIFTKDINLTPIEFLTGFLYAVCIGMPLFYSGLVLHFFEKRFINWIKHPYKSLVYTFLVLYSYATIIIFVVNFAWFTLFWKVPIADFFHHAKFSFISEYIVFTIISLFSFTRSFMKQWKLQVNEVEALTKERFRLKYKVFQNQVSPHFLFNSLNILSSLIDIDKEKSKVFTYELSNFYREVLEVKDKDLISLEQELNIGKRYMYLQGIRFEDALKISMMQPKEISGHVIPLSLQSLLENAIKHNEISKSKPLHITIEVKENEVVVKNNLQRKNLQEKSSKTGLKNLMGRYEFLTRKKMLIEENNDYFSVTIPLIQIEK